MKWGGNPDIQIGENEIKLGDTEITSENVLPTPTSEDVGKVPIVQEDGTYGLENIPSELPIVGNDDIGKFLGVGTNAHGDVLWATMDIPTELPAATNKDVGKVVSVDENGSYTLANAGGDNNEFIVKISVTSVGPTTTYSIDKTINEIQAAVNAGKHIVYKIGYSPDYVYTQIDGVGVYKRFGSTPFWCIIVLSDINATIGSTGITALSGLKYSVFCFDSGGQGTVNNGNLTFS